jgi:hypothetical protein
MERPLVAVTSLVALVIVIATDVLYVAVINAQGSSDPMVYVPRFIASYLAVMAAMIGVALLPRREVVEIRVPLRAAGAGGLLVMGLIGAFSIGLPLVVAGILTTVALSRTASVPASRWTRLLGLAAAVLAVAVLVVGLEVSMRMIRCPETGTSVGGGSGLVTGPYSYECRNGQLHWTS